MSKNNNHIEQLTPEILRLYHAGKLNAEQMHQVEKLMLDDSFYTDALDGFDEFSEAMLDQDLHALDNRLDEMLEESKPAIWLHWRKLAAAVILIGVCTSIFLLTQNEAPLPTKELTENKKTKSVDTTAVETKQPAAKIDTTLTETAPAQLQASEKAPIELNEVEEEISIDLDIEVSEKALAEIIFEEEVGDIVTSQAAVENERAALQKRNDSLLQSKAAGVASARLNTQAEAPAASFLPKENVLVGQVIDETGLALPGVTILKKGTGQGVSSNANGWFYLNQPDSSATYLAQFLGYVTQEFEPIYPDTIRIQLEPDAQALGEVVVTGLGRQTVTEPIKAKEAEPVIGYKDFQQYIKDNIRYPDAVRANKIRGRVVVSFTVESSGIIDNLIVEKSLGYGCDEEALRLIKEGPNWNAKVLSGGEPVASKVKVRIRFRP
ncbi:TonB family protein [Roseivirga pacifica]|uniref:TonB family C-terminal domain-containing protein n=1 Tax=Roseivirga pacifica TaxID=1267423 RepID=A0A1I0RA79_9BACT|nr:energy transducer TonB [Roseivirga pacifica]RKQ49289.1 TonB family protein [Roseivirga pacifica]SEW37684.1 TonB family C-terminal domain-containing protein [Roseivirga pacifica]